MKSHPHILLLLPDGRIHRLRWGSRAMSFREAPLTLTTLAALVPPELQARITLIDESIDPIPERIEADLVGISCLTGTCHRAYELADRFRRRGIPVVLGGVHVTLCPEEARMHADAMIRGFAERTWPALLRDWRAGRLQPEYHDPDPPLHPWPTPRRDLQRTSGYAVPYTVCATRGCRGGCDFCSVPAANQRWATRPVGDVVDEVRRLPRRLFAFNDVSLTEDRDYAMELFRALAPLKKRWGGLATARVGEDPELLEAMARAGCIYLLIGLESIHRAPLDRMGKAWNGPERYPHLIRSLHAHGICLQGCFIFGLDDDPPSIFEDTIAAVDEWAVDIPRYALLTPYPGTRLFHRLAAEGRLLHRHWPHYDTQHVVFRPRCFSPEELDARFRAALRATYSTRSIARRARRSPQPIVTAVGNLAYRLYVRRIEREPERIHAVRPEAVACPA
jgi:radical SAM superfamily enzyme YgiQ (UPF0313 family)